MPTQKHEGWFASNVDRQKALGLENSSPNSFQLQLCGKAYSPKTQVTANRLPLTRLSKSPGQSENGMTETKKSRTVSISFKNHIVTHRVKQVAQLGLSFYLVSEPLVSKGSLPALSVARVDLFAPLLSVCYCARFLF